MAELAEFTSTVLSILDKHAPIKRKHIHANNFAFTTKDLRAVITERSKFRQKKLKEKTDGSNYLYNRQKKSLCQLFVKNEKGIV